jgi:lauroyl/myristoyl acyltransferase
MPTGDEERDVRDLTSQIMRVLEGRVRAQPEQWFMFQPMWQSEDARRSSAQVAERPT